MLPTGKLAGRAFQQRFQPQQSGRVRYALPDLLVFLPKAGRGTQSQPVCQEPGQAAAAATHAQSKRKVTADVHLRIKGSFLKNHGHVASPWRQRVNDAAADLHRPRRGFFESGDQTQRGRFATAGRSEQHDQFAVSNLQGQVAHGLGAVGKSLAEVLQYDFSHGMSNLERDELILFSGA